MGQVGLVEGVRERKQDWSLVSVSRWGWSGVSVGAEFLWAEYCPIFLLSFIWPKTNRPLLF